MFPSCGFCWTYQTNNRIRGHNLRSKLVECCNSRGGNTGDSFDEEGEKLKRRSVLVYGISLLSSSAVVDFPSDGLAVVKQGLLAGRIPGLSEPDDQGWFPFFFFFIIIFF